MSLKILNFDCQIEDCSTYETRNCVPALIYSDNEDKTNQNADVLFISMVPAASDVDKGRPCTTAGSTVLERIINMAGAPEGGVAFTSLVRCRPRDPDGGTREPNGAEIAFCQNHLLRDLKRIKPKVLVFEGTATLKTVLPRANLLYNQVVDVELGGTTYTALAIIDPREFVIQTSLLTHVLDGVTKAFDIAELGTGSFHHPASWAVAPKLIYCDTLDKVRGMVDYLLHQTGPKQNCAFDVETKNLNARYGNNLVTLQFCVDPNDRVWIVPFHYMHSPFMDDELLEVKAQLKRLFTEKPGFRYWLTHNGVFEQIQTMQFITDGITFSNAPMFDTMNMAYNMDENRVTLMKTMGQGMALKVITPEFVGRDTYLDSVIEERKKGDLYKLPPEKLVPYAADDVINTQLVFRYMRACARATGYWEKLSLLTEHVGCGAFRTFAKLKRNGLYTDLPHLRRLTAKDSPIVSRMAEIKKIAHALPSGIAANKLLAKRLSGGQQPLFGLPWVFQFDKPEHYKVLLFETLGIKPVYGRNARDKKTEAPSVDKAFYEVYADAYEEVKLLHEYTGMKKLATSYTSSVLGFVDPGSPHIDHNTDGRVRPDFGFTNTVTGRPSCIAAGTLIETIRDVSVYPKGVPVEDVKAGDLVYCFDDNKKLTIKPVVWSGHTGKKQVIRLHWRGTGNHHKGFIDLTLEHKVRRVDGTYAAAADLVVGDRVMALSGTVSAYHVITGIEHLDVVDVYDLTIADTHNFIANEICVHNCSSPSIHNVPRADNPAKQEVKSMYCAEQSYGAWRLGKPVERVLMQLDYSAAEVRVWSILSGDTKLAKALYEGKLARMEFKKNPTPANRKRAELEGDIHRQTASQMFGVPLDQVTKELRQNTKAIVFALLYGGGPELIAARLRNDDIEAVKQMCDDFAASYPIGNKWLKDIENFARQHYYVESPIGRRRRLLEFMTGFREPIGAAKRLARNAPIQGMASDACILGATFWNDWIEQHGKDWKIVNIVHDSCVTELPIADLEEAAEAAERCFTVHLMNEMTRIWGVKFIAPLEVEFDFGIRWGHMKKWDGVPASMADIRQWLNDGASLVKE